MADERPTPGGHEGPGEHEPHGDLGGHESPGGHEAHGNPGGPGGPHAHDPRDLDVKAVAWVALGLAVFALVTHFALAGLLGVYQRAGGTAGQVTVPQRIQWLHEREEREAYEARMAKLGATYGWVDQDAGVVRVPVDHAMDLVAQRGIRWDLHDILPGPQQRPPRQAPARAPVSAAMGTPPGAPTGGTQP
jgi:hypothetical protein